MQHTACRTCGACLQCVDAPVLQKSDNQKGDQKNKEEKRAGPGRDPRLAPPVEKGRIQTLRELVPHLPDVTVPEWPFKGPKAIVELLRGLAASG